jgi:hypothetical protein
VNKTFSILKLKATKQENKMTITKTRNGGYQFSYVVCRLSNGNNCAYLFQKTYYGYTKTESKKRFIAALKQELLKTD